MVQDDFWELEFQNYRKLCGKRHKCNIHDYFTKYIAGCLFSCEFEIPIEDYEIEINVFLSFAYIIILNLN